MAPHAVVDAFSGLSFVVSILAFLAWAIAAIVNWYNLGRFAAATYSFIAFNVAAFSLENHLTGDFVVTLCILAMDGVCFVSSWLALWYIERHGWINVRSSLALLSIVAAIVVGGDFALSAGRISYDLLLRFAALMTVLIGAYLIVALAAAIHRKTART